MLTLPPLAARLPPLSPPGKWPDSLEAYQKTKAAIGCQLAQQLTHALGMEAAAAEDWVDVLAEGFAFRLLLAAERDAAMQHKWLAMSERRVGWDGWGRVTGAAGWAARVLGGLNGVLHTHLPVPSPPPPTRSRRGAAAG